MQPWVYFLIIGVIFFLMMRGGCGGHVMGHGHHRHRDQTGPLGPPGNETLNIPAQVRDPVCGMTIASATAKTSMHRRAIYYFCSDQCRGTFEAAPESYVTGSLPPSEQQHG